MKSCPDPGRTGNKTNAYNSPPSEESAGVEVAAYLQVPRDATILAPNTFCRTASNTVVGIRGFEPPVTFSTEFLVHIPEVRACWKLAVAEAAAKSLLNFDL